MQRLTILLVAVLVAACAPAEGPEAGPSASTATAAGATTTAPIQPEEPEPTTAWEQALAGMADPIPLQTAIDAFSVAFRPIEGATPTDLEPGYSGSGSGPLRWVLGHWEELSSTQQAQVEEILAQWEAGSLAAPSLPGGPLFAGRALYADQISQALVDDMVVNLEALLGRSLTIPVYAKVAGSGAEIDNNYAVAVSRDAAGGFSGPAAKCTIIFAPKALGFAGAAAVALAAHETFHCFEYALGTLQQAVGRPAWVVEGMAEWAGEVVSGGSDLSQDTWRDWLESFPYRALFSRAYDAIGFYAHVDDSGIDVWGRADQAILASGASSEAAYQVLVDGAPDGLIDSWAAGYFRDPAHAPLWDQDGPGITMDAPTIPEGFLSDESTYGLAAIPFAAFFVDLEVNAEVVTFESPGPGLALLADGTSARLADLHGAALCTTGACVCPAGTPGEGTVFTPASPGTFEIAATGHTSGSEVMVVGWSLDRYCRQERCQVGTWRSGAWHVPRVLAGGRDAPLWITREGEGYVDWSKAGDLYGVVQGGTAAGAEILPLRLVLSGASHFFGEMVGGSLRVTAAEGAVGVTPYIDLGDGWFETSGQGGAYLGLGKIGGDATFSCAGDTLVLSGAVEFWRVSTDAVIPPEAADLTPTTAAVGGGPPTTGGGLPAADPCSLLALAEVQELVPEATQPDGPDDLSTVFYTQCTFSPALAVQVYAPAGPDFLTQGVETLGVTVVPLPGIGDWALAEVNQPDPQWGIEETVVLMAAGSSAGVVALVPFRDVFPGTAEFAALAGLLQLALSRLGS